jgi:hypothetical protein
MNRTEIIWSLFLLLVGGLIGGMINRFYAKRSDEQSRNYAQRSSEELRKEAAKLRNLNNIIISPLENKGWAKVSRDEHGEPTGLILELFVKDRITATELFPPEVKIVDGPSRP